MVCQSPPGSPCGTQPERADGISKKSLDRSTTISTVRHLLALQPSNNTCIRDPGIICRGVASHLLHGPSCVCKPEAHLLLRLLAKFPMTVAYPLPTQL